MYDKSLLVHVRVHVHEGDVMHFVHVRLVHWLESVARMCI